MNELMPEFEQQFAAVTAEITSKTCNLLSNSNIQKDERVSIQNDIDVLLGDARELLERMELEVRDASQDQREKLRGRVKSYEVELRRLEKEFLRARSIYKGANMEEHIRQELFSSENQALTTGEEQRQRLLDNSETLERTSTRLDNSYKIALETENVGAMILNDLQSQRETLTHARSRLRDTDEELDKSSRVINVMIRRVLQNKFVVGVVLVAVAVIIIIAVVMRFTR